MERYEVLYENSKGFNLKHNINKEELEEFINSLPKEDQSSLVVRQIKPIQKDCEDWER